MAITTSPPGARRSDVPTEGRGARDDADPGPPERRPGPGPALRLADAHPDVRTVLELCAEVQAVTES